MKHGCRNRDGRKSRICRPRGNLHGVNTKHVRKKGSNIRGFRGRKRENRKRDIENDLVAKAEIMRCPDLIAAKARYCQGKEQS